MLFYGCIKYYIARKEREEKGGKVDDAGGSIIDNAIFSTMTLPQLTTSRYYNRYMVYFPRL